MTQFELSDFLDAPSAPYYCGFKASDIGASLYKIRDDSVRPRHFLGADNEDEIEAILSDREGHSLHEFIDGGEPLRPVIDFDLPVETLNAITPKISGGQAKNKLCCAFRDTCQEVFPKWDKKTMAIADSSDASKISLHVSTFGMRLPNIPQVAVFTELVRKKLPETLQGKSIIDNIANKSSFSLRLLGSPKYKEKTKEHIRVKKAICPKDGTVFDFMIRPPNDESEVVENSPLLAIPEREDKRCLTEGNENTDADIGQAEFDFIETLLRDNSIEGYTLSFPSNNIPDLFPLVRNSPSHCQICDREHENDNGYILRNKKSYRFYCHRANHEREPETTNLSVKLTISETALQREQKLPSPIKQDRSRISNPNDCFVWWDLICMCTSGSKFSRAEVYKAIQSTVAYIQLNKPVWILKHRDPENGLYFGMGAELKLAKFEIKIIEYGGEAVKLKSLIDQAVIKGLIVYADYDFLPYPISVPQPNTEFFNLFLGFLAKPAMNINKEIMDPILWHVRNIICDGNEVLNEYIWNWWALLVQKPQQKPRSILVLKSTLQQCGKNIITDFIGDKVLGPHLHFATSDLEKILGRFNSAIQARKLIVMNETGMSSGDKVACLNLFKILRLVSGNTKYFKRLGNILDHSDAPGVVMKYLLSLDISDFDPQEIPTTKMKSDIMRDQLPNPIRFIIDYIGSWAEDSIVRTGRTLLYQKYLEWCGDNGEKPFSNNIFGKKLSEKNIIECKQGRVGGGKREWQYILDRSKIIAKLRESGLGDMEEFSDIPQPEALKADDIPTNKGSQNETTDIPIFNVPETIPQKIISPLPEENLSLRDKKADKHDDSTQTLFDYVSEQAEVPIASTSRTSETSNPPEPVIDKPKSIKPISKIMNMPPKEADPPKPNEVSPAILLSRAQREERLRKRAVELGENPDAFVTITEKDRLDSITFRDRMETDS
ncbi:hypothetical protein RhiirA4_482753 [Rhizophagus irregularis]|uniref:DNA primase/nucleoside triphosphatase C-terminal domain-containing protein n=1 Tax=Rhizophagus irregularis TaxID=588596 RepID=A0A2I1HLI9_9GLOM|nr:hypothetical protein RhiirA4_482753 [Rhizophagus irregularis]